MLNRLIQINNCLCMIAIMGLLTSCATLPAHQAALNQNISWASREQSLHQIQSWDIQGAIAIRTPQKKLSSSIHWHQYREHYQIHLFGPLGIGTTIIRGAPHKVTLQTAKKQIFSAHDPEQLVQQQLGWTLPISNLYFWIRGLPAPGLPASKTFDAYQHLALLKQDGWHIQYLHYTGTKRADLPSKMVISRPGLNLRIVISNWS